MLHVKITHEFEWPLRRQTPGQSKVWGQSRFSINERDSDCDWWVVIEDLPHTETTNCPSGRKILITGEPPTFKSYHPQFLQQFDLIFSPHPPRKAPNVEWFRTQLGLPWMVGGKFDEETHRWKTEAFTLDYDQLNQMDVPKKNRELSAIVSTKAFSRGHRNRLRFIEKLKADLGDRLDLFGNGIRFVEDKWDAIAPYRYHLVIENCQTQGYWSEKLMDPYLGYAYPIYCGAPDIHDYFSPDALSVFSIGRYEKAKSLILRLLESDMDKSSFVALCKARHDVLHKYNVFAYLDAFLGKRTEGQSTVGMQTVTLRPQKDYPKARNWKPKFLR